jgi:hypothetical protein
MKTKPILITAGILVLLTCVFLFVRSRNLVKPEKAEINQFLYGFSNQINEGNADSLLAFFEVDKTPKVLKRLVNFLAGKRDINGKGKPIAAIRLDVDGSTVTIVNSELIIANIPAKFSHDSLDSKSSILILKIRKIAPHQFKIIQVDARRLLTDYLAYANFVRSKTVDEKDIFSPITLAAFKTAEQLKASYDSVIWFAHLDNKTFFYVVKGKWDMRKDIYERYIYSKYTRRFKDSVIEPYKMGLVGPGLKEVIPPEYDLIYNINGTYPGLVEVEKGNKKGFYDLEGKNIVPVKYDQIYPIEDEINLAVLKNGDNFFYLKKDMSISEKVDLKISDFFSKIVKLKNSFNLNTNASSIITEYNSHEENGALYIPPSYLVDLNMVGKVQNFKNPLRKSLNDEVHIDYKVDISDKIEMADNWFEATFYSIRDHFIGGRGEFYDKKNLVIIDKKKNRVFSQDIGTDYSPGEGEGSLNGICDISSIKAINDTLFEVKAGAVLWAELYDSTKSIIGGTYYHYLAVKDNKLVELPNNRNFGFTKYVKMDDSYLTGCYNMLIGSGNYDNRQKNSIDHLTLEILHYIKNEIYADYRYQFKDKRWQEIFMDMPSYNTGDQEKKNNASVDDSLTTIDKYNINWINQKLKGTQGKKLASR